MLNTCSPESEESQSRLQKVQARHPNKLPIIFWMKKTSTKFKFISKPNTRFSVFTAHIRKALGSQKDKAFLFFGSNDKQINGDVLLEDLHRELSDSEGFVNIFVQEVETFGAN